MAIDFKAKNNPPKWKKQEFFSFTTNATNEYTVTVDSVIPIDRIRISFSSVFAYPKEATVGILAYSTITNSYVGTMTKNAAINNGTDVIFSDVLQPNEGMNFIYHNKVLLQGSYQVKLYKYDGTVYSDANDVFYMFVEYFVDE